MNLVIFDKDNRTEMAGIGIFVVAVFAAGVVAALGGVELINRAASGPIALKPAVEIECSQDGYSFSLILKPSEPCPFVRFKYASPSVTITTPYFYLPAADRPKGYQK